MKTRGDGIVFQYSEGVNGGERRASRDLEGVNGGERRASRDLEGVNGGIHRFSELDSQISELDSQILGSFLCRAPKDVAMHTLPFQHRFPNYPAANASTFLRRVPTDAATHALTSQHLRGLTAAMWSWRYQTSGPTLATVTTLR